MNKFYQHFSSEDKKWIDKVLEMAERVKDSYVFEVSHFVNPYQAQIIESLARHEGLTCFRSDQFYPTEFVRVILAPDYYQLDLEDFGLALLEIDYNHKFNHLKHGQILGALLHQLGIERHVLGDILLANGRAQILVEAQFASFFEMNVSKIANASVRLQKIPLDQMIQTQSQATTKEILVASLRLDAVIGACFFLSRSKTLNYCRSGRVKVNYRLVEKADYSVTISDLISVRGCGRCKVSADLGLSKSGKHKLRVDIIANK